MICGQRLADTFASAFLKLAAWKNDSSSRPWISPRAAFCTGSVADLVAALWSTSAEIASVAIVNTMRMRRSGGPLPPSSCAGTGLVDVPTIDCGEGCSFTRPNTGLTLPWPRVRAQACEMVGGVKRIGLLGGMSWESSAEYYRLVNEMVRERLGGLSSADCLLRSVDFAPVEELQRTGRWDEAGGMVGARGAGLRGAGAGVLGPCPETLDQPGR